MVWIPPSTPRHIPDQTTSLQVPLLFQLNTGQFSQDVLQHVENLRAFISGDGTSRYDPIDPLRLWVIQVAIIILLTQVLSLVLGRVRQPRVIAEVIGGVLLGPSVMGRIPHFTAVIFPVASIPFLRLTATIGLVFFLFLVGLEIDIRVIQRNAKAAMSVSAAGFILPFGLGAAIAVPIYHQFIDESVNIGFFVLFVAVAVGITAFPVLCRILTELRLLDTTVGIIVLSAGVGNDVVAWILLALTVALVNAASGLTALWVLLTSVAYVLFLLFPVRWVFIWLARKTGSLENGQPTTLMMTVTLLLVLLSALFTDTIGVHAIFGGFLAGLIIPHEGGFAISLVEKLEDFVSIVFLPIYFTLSGLNTDLATLDNGVTWGYTVLICVVAFLGKFSGSFLTAKLNGFTLRECGAIGSLMSCKGLVELIVLNVGLQAGILNTRVFSMFVVEALFLTFMTTPLTLLWYPMWYRTPIPAVGSTIPDEGPSRMDSSDERKTNFTVVLDRAEHLPAIMTITQLLQGSAVPECPCTPSSSASTVNEGKTAVTTITVNALRLIELTERTSAVLQSQEADALIHRDSVVSVFRTFGHLHRIPVAAALSVVNHDAFPGAVATYARDTGAEMVIVPWSLAAPEEQGALQAPGPFDGLFARSDAAASVVYPHFVRQVFARSPTDVALYVDRGRPGPADVAAGHHVFLPFFGGPDDRLALAFVVQLCANSAVTATIVRIKKVEDVREATVNPVNNTGDNGAAGQLTAESTAALDTIYFHDDTQTQLASETADNLLWSCYVKYGFPHPPRVGEALKRIVFSDEACPQPLHSIVALAAAAATNATESCRSLLVVVGRGRRKGVESHQGELKQLMAEHESVAGDVRKTLGDVAGAFVAAKTTASLLVLQAALFSASD